MCRRTIYCNECQIKNCAQNRPSIRTQIRTRVDGPLASHFHCFQIGTAAAKSSRFLELPFFFSFGFSDNRRFCCSEGSRCDHAACCLFPRPRTQLLLRLTLRQGDKKVVCDSTGLGKNLSHVENGVLPRLT
jgi:hypothetical protein